MDTTDTATTPSSELQQLEQYQHHQAGDFYPTMHLRIAVPAGTHFPDQQKLQQLWHAPTLGGGIVEQWRDIPKVIV